MNSFEIEKTDAISLDLKDLWIPSKENYVKYLNIKAEIVSNNRSKCLDNKTPYEYMCEGYDFGYMVRSIPGMDRAAILKELSTLTEIKRDVAYSSVFKKTGGVLNLFHPWIKASMDRDLIGLEHKNGTMDSIKEWAFKNSDLWSTLPPALVWAGTGQIEGKLLDDFMQKLGDSLSGQAFESMGEAILKSTNFLRKWQQETNYVCDGKKPYEAIREERRQTLYDKLKCLGEYGYMVPWL